MIDLVDVSQHYGIRPVLRRISLQIRRGELVVVVGPNGMGKTALLGVMAGVLQPQHGTVRIDGRQPCYSPSSFSCFASTAAGAPVIRSRAR